jgi:hypothetical protein
MPKATRIVFAACLLACVSVFSCCSPTVETRPEAIQITVGELEPPILDLLAKMGGKGMDVENYQRILSQPLDTSFPLMELEMLPGDLRAFAGETESAPDAFLAAQMAEAIDRLLDKP